MLSLTVRQFSAVAVGGVIGALGRYMILELAVGTALDGMWGVAFVNLIGCAFLAVIIVYGETHWDYQHRWQHVWRPLLTTGVTGGFTTTSSFAAIAVTNATDQPAMVMLNIAVSVVGGLAVFHVVHSLASRTWSLLP